MFSKFLLCTLVLMLISACGGQMMPPPTLPATGSGVPVPSAVPPASQICLACPTIPAPPAESPFFNSSMIGLHMTFTDGLGHHTFYALNPTPPSNYYPPGSITMNITKDFSCTYWLSCVPDAFIDFVLSPNDDGSYNSHGWVVYTPTTVPSWLPCHSSPCTEQVLAPDGSHNTYLITPPIGLSRNQTLITETVYTRWDQPGQSFDSILLGQPTAQVYWKTIFSMTPDGLAISDQYEGNCGHERWYFKANVGLVRVESPNDGHGVGFNCAGQSTATIDRIN